MSNKVTYWAQSGHWTAIKISFDALPFYSRGIHYSSGTVRVRWVIVYLKAFSGNISLLTEQFSNQVSWFHHLGKGHLMLKKKMDGHKGKVYLLTCGWQCLYKIWRGWEKNENYDRLCAYLGGSHGQWLKVFGDRRSRQNGQGTFQPCLPIISNKLVMKWWSLIIMEVSSLFRKQSAWWLPKALIISI